MVLPDRGSAINVERFRNALMWVNDLIASFAEILPADTHVLSIRITIESWKTMEPIGNTILIPERNGELEVSNTETAPISTPGSSGTTSLTWGDVENYWVQAGGNAQAASMAAAIADASSGLNPDTTRQNPDGTTSVGLWLIPQNGTPPGSTDPLANARAAVQLSNNGTDWSQWCVTWSDNNCGENGGSYLGQGANALQALEGQGGSFNLAGAQPATSGVGASSATTSTGTSTSGTSGKSNVFLLGIALVVLIVIFLWWRRRNPQSTETTDVSTEPQ